MLLIGQQKSLRVGNITCRPSNFSLFLFLFLFLFDYAIMSVQWPLLRLEFRHLAHEEYSSRTALLNQEDERTIDVDKSYQRIIIN